MPAASNLTFTLASGFAPVINNRDETAFAALTENSAGEPISGIFFKTPDGPIVPVAVPGQVLPDGHTLTYAFNPTLNDAGMIAFWAFLQDNSEIAATTPIFGKRTSPPWSQHALTRRAGGRPPGSFGRG